MPHRPKTLAKLYSSPQWKATRLRILDRDGRRCYVEGCDREATHADHVIPALEAPHLFFDEDNLRAACAPHNLGRSSPRMAAMARINRAPGTVRPW